MDGVERGRDVAVLGGGPAGLAAALALAQRGFRVAVYDGQRPPIDKACGEGLMPEAVRLLQSLGVLLDARDGAPDGVPIGMPFQGISFHAAGRHADADFDAVKTPGCAGLGMRRTRLHGRMVERAAAMGVALYWGVSVQAVDGGFAAMGARITADFFVIADGLCSTLARAGGFRERGVASTRYASRQQFRCAPSSKRVEVYWGASEQLYVTPLGAAEIGVALLTGKRGRTLDSALDDFPEVAQRIAGATRTSTMRGAVTRTRSLRAVVRGNIAVVGDASGSVDAITGEGLLGALRQANALAEALATGEPRRYEAAHRAMARQPRRMARLLLLLDRHPRLARRFVAAMATRPRIFSALLEVHLGNRSWAHLLRIRHFPQARIDSKWGYPVPQAYRERGL